MARIRSIKPEYWKSEAIAALSMQTRLTFIALWSYVDDNGVGRDNPKLIAAELYPLEEDPRETLAHVSRSLDELANNFRIARYTVAGKRYLYISNWEEHQKIDRPGKPRYPLPDQADKPPTCGNADPRETLAQPSRDTRATPSPGAVEQGTGEQGVPTTSDNLPVVAADEPGIGEVVKAYVDGATTAGLPRPSERLRGKVGRDAKRLAHEQVPVGALIAAARSMGERGWDDIDRELQRVGANTAKPKPSTSDQRVATGNALVAAYAAREAGQ